MITVFDKLPEWFILRYDAEICAWAANFQKIGPVKTFVLREGYHSDMSPDPEIGPVLLGARLIARMEKNRDRVTISPFDDQDREVIARHCRKMVGLGIPPNARLREPMRPGMPAFPTIRAPAKKELN